MDTLTKGVDRVIEGKPEGSVIKLELALSLHILFRASEIWVYGHDSGTLTFASLERDWFYLPEHSYSRGQENRRQSRSGVPRVEFRQQNVGSDREKDQIGDRE